MAQADSYDERIHIAGTSTQSGSYAGWYLPLSGYTIQSGDRISWRQYQTAARGGIGISFVGGGSTNWTTEDTDGQVMNSDTTEGAWHERTVDLTPFAGKSVNHLWITADAATPVGSWSILYGEIAIYSADGTVTSIYDRQPDVGLSYFTGGGETNTQAALFGSPTRRWTCSGITTYPVTKISYRVRIVSKDCCTRSLAAAEPRYCRHR